MKRIDMIFIVRLAFLLEVLKAFAHLN